MTKRQTAEEFAEEFEQLAETFGDDMTDALIECKSPISEGIEDNFRKSQTSEGQAWPPRKDPGPTHPLLILTGTLMLSATLGGVQRIEDGSILVYGTSTDILAYARRQQLGDTTWPAKGIAPRPYVGISDTTLDECAEIVADHALAEVT